MHNIIISFSWRKVMEYLKKIFIFVLMLLTLNLYFPFTAFSEPAHLYAKTNIKKHVPQTRSTKEKEIPGMKVPDERSWFARNWLWLLLGVGVVAGVGAGGGGSGGGGGTSDNGEVIVSW